MSSFISTITLLLIIGISNASTTTSKNDLELSIFHNKCFETFKLVLEKVERYHFIIIVFLIQRILFNRIFNIQYRRFFGFLDILAFIHIPYMYEKIALLY